LCDYVIAYFIDRQQNFDNCDKVLLEIVQSDDNVIRAFDEIGQFCKENLLLSLMQLASQQYDYVPISHSYRVLEEWSEGFFTFSLINVTSN